jgi:predicted GNAT superfamily acetyltransferase
MTKSLLATAQLPPTTKNQKTTRPHHNNPLTFTPAPRHDPSASPCDNPRRRAITDSGRKPDCAPVRVAQEQDMSLTVRDVQTHELDAILALNNAAGSTILPLDGTGIARLADHASYLRVAEADGQLAGFLLALREGAPYESPNYRWFSERYPEFVYIDRIVIARPFRRLGLGRVFYADVTSYAEVRVPVLTCEVFLEPRDDVSVLFHGTYGFQEVGQQTMAGVNRRVALLAKDLCSYAFVREHYLRGDGLPNVPWLAERARVERMSSERPPAAKRAAGGG